MKMKKNVNEETRSMYNVIFAAEALLRDCLSSGSDGDNIFYQYTKMETLEAIWGSGCLRATDMKYLNDSLEYQSGINTIKEIYANDTDPNSKIIRKNLNKYKNEYERNNFSTFSISFCEDGDLLSQWITYAKEGGVSIGFDFSSDSLFWGQKISDYYFRTNEMKKPLEVMYVNSQNPLTKTQEHNIKGLMEKITGSEMTTSDERLAFYMALCYIKNSDFSPEREHRIVSIPCHNGISYGDEKKRFSEIKTSLQSSHVFRPYIELYPIKKDNSFAGLPVAEIIVGPASNQVSIFNSLINKLEHSFSEDIKFEVPSSKIITARKKRYAALVSDMKNKKMKINEIYNKIHFCEKWGLIIRTSESSYVF